MAYIKKQQNTITKDELCNYIARYKAGESLSKIAKPTEFDHKKLAKMFREVGVEIRPKYPKLANHEIQNIVLRYESGEGINDIANNLRHRVDFIKKHLLNAGVKLRTRAEFLKLAHKKNPDKWRKHSIDQTVFDKITEESAYWIGFLMADGCVHKSNISLGLHYKDVNHIEKFRKFLKSSHKIHTIVFKTNLSCKISKSATFNFRSDKIASSLENFGVVPRKSLTAKVKGLETDRHFWRGVIDGDGSIGIDKRHNAPYIHLIGSRDLVTQFLDFVKSIVNTNVKIRDVYKNGRTFTLALNCRKAVEIISVLYDDCNIYLDRKYESFKKIKNHYTNADNDKLLLDKLTLKIGEMYLQGNSGSKINKVVGASLTKIYYHLNRYAVLTGEKIPRRHKFRKPHISVYYREQGLCKDCGAETLSNYARCELHLQKNRIYQRNKYQINKKETQT